MSLFSTGHRPTAPAAGMASLTPGQRLTLAQLADAIGRNKSQICRWAQRPGFPVHKENGQTTYVAGDVESWIDANINSRAKRSGSTLTESQPADRPANPAALATASDPAIAAMMDGTASAKEITHYAVHLASRKVAIAAIGNALGPAELDALKKALQELRNAEADYIELEKAKAQVITRAQALGIIGDCVARLIRAQGMIANKLATEISIWLADPDAAKTPLDNWSRRVREFVDKTCNEVRRLEADGVEALLAKVSAAEGR